MTVTIAVAVGANGVIGRENQMPWPRTGDMRQFKALTLGHPVIMGRATYESIGKPLPSRTNIVLTRQANWDPSHDDAIVAANLDEALEIAHTIDPDVFIIGGAAVYAEARDCGLVDVMVITHVPLSPEGDAFFDPILAKDWTEVDRVAHYGTPAYEIVTYVRS